MNHLVRIARATTVLACLVACSAPTSSFAQTAPANPAKVQSAAPDKTDPNAPLMQTCSTLIKGLGLKITNTDKNLISFIDRGDQYNLIAAEDGSLLYVTIWWNIPKDKANHIPFDTLMGWNSTHSTYFGMQRNDDGSVGIVMSENFPSADVSATMLRDKIDIIQQDSDTENSKLDTSQWK